MNDIPAKLAKKNAQHLWSSCLPTVFRKSFEAEAAVWSKKSMAEWDDEWLLQRSPMQSLIIRLAEELDTEDWTPLLSSCEQSLLLFYVLRLQWAALHLELMSDETRVPARLKDFWLWAMTVKPDESWMDWTVRLKGVRCPWGYAQPIDYKEVLDYNPEWLVRLEEAISKQVNAAGIVHVKQVTEAQEQLADAWVLAWIDGEGYPLNDEICQIIWPRVRAVRLLLRSSKLYNMFPFDGHAPSAAKVLLVDQRSDLRRLLNKVDSETN